MGAPACLGCGASLLGEGQNARKRCDPCEEAWRRRYHAAYQRKRRAGDRDPHTCGDCGVTIQPTGGRGRPPKWCASCEMRVCPICGTHFRRYQVRGYEKLTCSRPCKGKLQEEICAARLAVMPESDREARREAERERWRARNRVRRSPGMVRERYTLAEIAERDGYRCQLCQRRVNMALKSPHPRSATIDHVIPISLGGDDTRVNVQLAHRRCNTAKGNRAVGEQLALIG